MSFLESLQHGLEKASQEAARITKIQHLHNVVNDLTFKITQQGEKLIEQAMEMYRGGHLGQGELVAICQQIATYQQNISEVREELERLHQSGDDAGQQASPAAPPAQPVTQASTRGRTPTQPLVAAHAAAAEPEHKASAPKKHPAAHTENAPVESAPAPATGTHTQGALPPIYSPFVNKPAQAAASAPAAQEAPAQVHHSTKKADAAENKTN